MFFDCTMKRSEKGAKSMPPRVSKVPKKVRDKLKRLWKEMLEKCTVIKALFQQCKKVDWEETKVFFDLLQAIMELEKAYAPNLPQREENHWEAFYSWCSEHNANFKDIVFKEIQDGNFGAVAERDIKENEPFLTVPRKMMMSDFTAKASKLGPLISTDPVLKDMPNVQVAMQLVLEVINDESQWMPYISILPPTFNTILYFTFDELKELQGSPVVDDILKILYSVVRQYCYFSQLFHSNPYARSLEIGQYFTYELYRWAVSVVMTRQNFVPSPDAAVNLTCLIPLFDMCNHTNGRLSTEFSLEEDRLISYACKPFKKGSEVCTFYGNRTNGEFLVHNAFVYPENENDAILIKLGVGSKDSLVTLKKDLCKKLKISPNGPFYVHKGGIIGQVLMTFLQVNVMNAGELQSFLKEDNDEEIIRPSGKYPELHKRALTFLRDRINLLLKCYKTTLEEDEDLLKSSVPETEKMHLIIQLRICEKKILRDVYNFCDEKTR